MHKASLHERPAFFEEESIVAVCADWLVQKSILQIAVQLFEWISFGYVHTLFVFSPCMNIEALGFFFFFLWVCLPQAKFNFEA